MTSSRSPGLSVGILLGGLVIVSAWVLSMIYVLWANGRYDRIVAEALSAARIDASYSISGSSCWWRSTSRCFPSCSVRCRPNIVNSVE